MDKSEVIRLVEKYSILVRENIPNAQIYLYGSYAQNKQREDSDIDVAIIVDKIDGDFFSTSPLLWKLRRQVDNRIEPILIEKDYDSAGFFEDIKKYAIEIK